MHFGMHKSTGLESTLRFFVGRAIDLLNADQGVCTETGTRCRACCQIDGKRAGSIVVIDSVEVRTTVQSVVASAAA